MRKIFFFICTVLLLYIVGLFAYIPIAAAQEIGLGVTKNTFDLAVFPGDSYRDEIVLFNESDSAAVPVHIELSLWNLKEDADDFEFVLAEPALNAAKWFVLQEGSDLILAPEESRKIPFRIDVPRDAALGSYFVMMRFRAVLPDFYFAEQGPRFLPEIAPLFFMKVTSLHLEDNEGLYGADILEFKAKDANPLPFLGALVPPARAAVFEELVERFATKIRNTGLYHFQASGYVEIKDFFGTRVAMADIPPRYLLPNRNRSFDIDVIDEEQSFWRRHAYFGSYTAQLVLNVPGSGTPVIMQEQFWVFPWKTILVLVVLIIGLLATRRRARMAFRALWG